VAKWKSGKPTVVKIKRIAKRKNGNYIHPHNKLIVLRSKMPEANLREEGLVRKMADFRRILLPDHTAEREPKNDVQESNIPIEIPLAVKPKRESRDDDEDAEIKDLRDSDKTTYFRDTLYGIRKEGDTLMIGNSEVDFDEPGVIAVKGKRFKLTKKLWDLLTLNDVNTCTISPNDMRRYKTFKR
jgi:hypothetical protein